MVEHELLLPARHSAGDRGSGSGSGTGSKIVARRQVVEWPGRRPQWWLSLCDSGGCIVGVVVAQACGLAPADEKSLRWPSW